MAEADVQLLPLSQFRQALVDHLRRQGKYGGETVPDEYMRRVTMLRFDPAAAAAADPQQPYTIAARPELHRVIIPFTRSDQVELARLVANLDLAQQYAMWFQLSVHVDIVVDDAEYATHRVKATVVTSVPIP